jgi:hypothetical protein
VIGSDDDTELPVDETEPLAEPTPDAAAE